MTLSKAERLADADLALRLMIEELGERAFFRRVLSPTDRPPYEGILPTTWQDLEDRFLIERFMSAGRIRRYELTGSGWLRGLELTGALDATKEKAGTVMGAIKKQVEGRRDRAVVYSNSIAEGAGLTVDFVHNLLDSDFIPIVFKQKGVKFDRCTGGVYQIVIPVNFGLELP